VGPRAGLDGSGKSHPPPRFDPPDSPARSESLYRLSYPGPENTEGIAVLCTGRPPIGVMIPEAILYNFDLLMMSTCARNM
jgi:hypothetical protein